MAKIPKDPREIFQDIIDDYKGLFNEDLISIILYGSAVGKDYQPGKSDINFMIVLSDEGMIRLTGHLRLMKSGLKERWLFPFF